MWILAAILLLAQDDKLGELKKIRQSIRDRNAQAALLVREAHRELDRGHYEAATRKHLEARKCAAEAVALAKKEIAFVDEIVADMIVKLDDDSFDVRERAVRNLVLLGPSALPPIQKAYDRACRDGSPEVKERLRHVLARLRGMNLDGEGRVRQWASEARASTEYSPDDWSAKQATGKPDTETGGDSRTAWASREADGAEEWLELVYEHPVRPTLVRVHETYNPGAVSKIEALDGDGRWRLLWEGTDPTRECPGWLSPTFSPPDFATKAIRVTLDSDRVPGWNEIDAVELVGEPEDK